MMDRSAQTPRIMVAGIGNVFFGDDGFGVTVANRLATRSFGPDVHVEDYGIRGVHLAFDIADAYDALVLVDAVPLAEPAGTLAVIEPEVGDSVDNDNAAIDSHRMTPAVVLNALAALGVAIDTVYLVACQPLTITRGMGLSAPVAAAVDTACEMVVDLVSILREPADTKAS